MVVLYGDSLAWEAESFFRWMLTAAGADVEARTHGGTAICDYLDDMAKDAAELQPDAVVIEFSGNAFTTCMTDRTGMSLVDAYRFDVEAVFRIFPTARVYMAGSPITEKAQKIGKVHGGAMDDLYREMASRHTSGRFVDAGSAVLDGGRWTGTLPCLPNEPCTGGSDPAGRPVNVVRDPLGVHFCPASAAARRGVTNTCPVWSSGAFRYGATMAEAVASDLPSEQEAQ